MLNSVGRLVQTATVVVAALALLVFFWGLVKFISKAGDQAAIEEGRKLMIWGVLALFVMVSVWGILHILQETLFGIPVNSSMKPCS